MTSLKQGNEKKSQIFGAFRFIRRHETFVGIKSGPYTIGEFNKYDVDIILEEYRKLPKSNKEHGFFSALWLAQLFKNHSFSVVRNYNYSFFKLVKVDKEIHLFQITPGHFGERTQWQVGVSDNRVSGNIVNDYRLLFLIIRLFRDKA